MSNVAVVGGGIAGLIAAIALARGGAGVTLFERAGALGGRAPSRVEDGFVFNQGPHALYRGGAFAATLAAFGVAVTGGPPDFREAAAIWGDERHPFPRNFATIAAGAPLNFAERLRMLRLFAMLPRLDLGAWRGRPFSEYAGELPARPRALVQALTRLSTYAHAPDALDAAAALAQFQLAAQGVIYVDGGWSALVEGLARRRARRGRRHEGSPARSRPSSAPREDGASASTRPPSFVADAVVLTAPPAAAAALLPPSASLAAAARAATPIRAISLDYALRRLPKPKATFALGIDKPLYYSVHSASAKLAPAGGALLHASRYLAPDEAADAEKIGEVDRARRPYAAGLRGRGRGVRAAHRHARDLRFSARRRGGAHGAACARRCAGRVPRRRLGRRRRDAVRRLGEIRARGGGVTRSPHGARPPTAVPDGTSVRKGARFRSGAAASRPPSLPGAEPSAAWTPPLHCGGGRRRRYFLAMKTYRIAAIPGDGIGAEVVDAGVEVLAALAQREGGFALHFDRFDWGGEYYKKHGRMMPADGREQIRASRRDPVRLRRPSRHPRSHHAMGPAPRDLPAVRSIRQRQADPHPARHHLAAAQCRRARSSTG